MRSQDARWRSWAAALGVLLAASAAHAHVVVSRGTLRQWLQYSTTSLRVEILAGPEVWVAPSGDRQEFFRARVLERLAGEPVGADEIDFFPHAEGFPAFEPGRQHLLFLERTATRPEFAGLAARFPWFSAQGAGEEWPLPTSTGGAPAARDGGPTLAWARDWAAWLGAGGTDVGWLARLLDAGLAAREDALQADALMELMRGHDLPGLLDAEGTARFAARLASPDLPLSRRAALLRLLAGRPGFDADAACARLIAEAGTSEARRTLAAQLAASDLAPVAPWLASLAEDPDPALRRAAVEAQGRRGARADLGVLAGALGDPSDAVARAAIRALGGHPDPRARRLLQAMAEGHGPRARWSKAELRRARP
jgi:hypothetical protein